MKTKLAIETIKQNVAPKFEKAIYRKYSVNKTFVSAKEARKTYNLSRCNYYYYYIDSKGNEVITRRFFNAN